jgi:hypothetical protein
MRGRGLFGEGASAIHLAGVANARTGERGKAANDLIGNKRRTSGPRGVHTQTNRPTRTDSGTGKNRDQLENKVA